MYIILQKIYSIEFKKGHIVSRHACIVSVPVTIRDSDHRL